MIINFLFFFLVSSAYSYEEGELRKYFAADEWTSYPSNSFDNFSRIPVNEPVNFYRSPEFKGKPDYSFQYPYLKDVSSGRQCEVRLQASKMLVSKWMECRPFKCTVYKEKKVTEKLIFSPMLLAWYEPGTENKCNISTDIKIDNIKNGDFFSYLILPNKKREVLINNIAYYPDTRFCKDSYPLCEFDIPGNHDEKSLQFRVKASQGYRSLEDIVPVKKCFSARDVSQCLRDLPATRKDVADDQVNFLDVGQFVPVIWNSENIEELRACLSSNSIINDTEYMGIKKKCKRYGNKILAIDYPEAFVMHSEVTFKFVSLP